jgi:hypothetical protein
MSKYPSSQCRYLSNLASPIKNVSQQGTSTGFREIKETSYHRSTGLGPLGLVSGSGPVLRQYFARIVWSKPFCKEFEDLFGFDDPKPFPDQPMFFVTLTDVSCTTDHDASSVGISKFKRKLQAGLRGLHYLGMVEPGLYVNVALGTRWSNKKSVSGHLHGICWGENRQQIKKRFCRLNWDGWYVSILGSQRGAEQKEIVDRWLPRNRDRTFLADKLRYLLKSPKKAYRIYKTERMTSDGELVPCFRQRKSQFRRGIASRSFIL